MLRVETPTTFLLSDEAAAVGGGGIDGEAVWGRAYVVVQFFREFGGWFGFSGGGGALEEGEGRR